MRHYDVELRLNPTTRRLEGRVRLLVRHPDTLAALPLAFDGLSVKRVAVDGRPVDARRPPHRLVVPLDGDTTSTIEITYGGVPETGLYAGTHEGQRVVYTDSWPVRGRGWLPGVHHPSDPATLDLMLLVPRGREAVATGEPVAVDTLHRWTRYRWELEAAAPTYTFAFAVSDFAGTCAETFLGDRPRGAAAAPWWPVCSFMLAPDSAQASRLRRTPQMLAYFSDLLGPYGYDRYAAVQTPLSFGGMENAATAFLRASLFDEGAVEEVQVHEVAHQWFGNRVVLAGWRDLWLSEGTATYLTTLFYEHADGIDRARQLWVEMPADSSAWGVLVPAGPVDPSAHLTAAVYNKGASVMHLLRRTLGDSTFFRALRTTYARYAGRPLSTEDFKRILEAASGRDLTALFDYWVYGDRLPVLRTSWNAETGTLRWSIEGDAGTLDGVPFDLMIRQDGRVEYVDVRAGSAELPGSEAPTVRPVGIMMRVE